MSDEVNKTKIVKNSDPLFNNKPAEDSQPNSNAIPKTLTSISSKVIARVNLSLDRWVQKGKPLDVGDHSAILQLTLAIVKEIYPALNGSAQSNQAAHLSMYSVLMQIHDAVKIRAVQFQFSDATIADYAIHAIKYAIADSIFVHRNSLPKGVTLFSQGTQSIEQSLTSSTRDDIGESSSFGIS